MIDAAAGRSAASWACAVGALPRAADWPPAEPWAVVAPHPDDEVLGVGGALVRAAQCGVEVHVVTVTDGEAAWPGHGPAERARLGRRRRAESAAADRELGLRPVRTFLGLPDGGVAARHEELVDRLGTALEGISTIAVVASDDGHPDHDATGRAIEHVAADGGQRLVRHAVWAWNWDVDTTARLAGASALELDAATRDRKRRAVLAHASQVEPVEGRAILPRRFLAHHLGLREVVWCG